MSSVFIALLYLLGSKCVAKEAELNTDFLQGVTGVPSVFQSEIKYPVGQYYVDVLLNGATTARSFLSINEKDEKAGYLCFSPEWLQHAGIYFKPDLYAESFDNVQGCYVLEKIEHTRIEFDHSSQTVNFIIPQAYLLNKEDAVFWDYGVDGLKLSYNGNFNKRSDDSLNAFGSFDTNINLGQWVLSSRMNAAKNPYGSEFTTNDLLLSTAISELRGDFLLGLSHTRTELFSTFGFYGVSLRSNSNMRPWNVSGYAPLITGLATSTSRITISQDGYTIYSKVVPAGPYQLDDISPVGNGDLLVTVEDDNGVKTSSIYPVSTLPSLLRPGDFNYNFVVGEKSIGNELKDAFASNEGPFLLASVDYGLPSATVNMAAILHTNYQAAGIGITQSLDEWGIYSSSVNFAKATYDDFTSVEGANFSFKYAKNFTNKTDLQLLTYRYQSEGYREFSAFDPSTRYDIKQEKARYEARLSHRFDNNVYLTASLWQQSYWGDNKDTIGANLSASSTLFDVMSVYVNGNYSHTGYIEQNQNNYSVSVGFSVPFNLFGLNHYNNSSIGYSGSTTSFNTGISAVVNNRLNYSLNANTDLQNSNDASVNVGYSFDNVQTTFGVSQSSDHTTFSGSLSGSAVVTAESGLLFTRESANTIAIVKIPDMPGITFNNSLPTNEDGQTAVYLSSYNTTNINIDTHNLPDDIELLDSSHSLIPTQNAIIYREFNVVNVQRYILRVRDAQGNIMAGGNAQTDTGVNAGFISSNGVLLMQLQVKPEWVTISKNNGQSCKADLSTLTANTNSVQEVHCE
ncbi:fimbrial protein [Shewanella xiamenensis]|nr:fimbrial protein [Shewanella xiamenensis]TVL21413.1 fimbrial protein [Shewanella xiamenensis]TVL27446.1 fimbrial protein [Shewanella xiamenensis]TVL34993.1 fimbrial protein [Shewanella xiamenensis]TVL36234.1 fimbrial protein [Shewanella xiamenensis]